MKKERILLSIFEVAAWMGIQPSQVKALIKVGMPTYGGTKFYQPDIENWMDAYGLAATDEEDE